MTHYLVEEEILLAHFKLIKRYGGSHGIRSRERIKSLVDASRQEVFAVQIATEHSDIPTIAVWFEMHTV